MNQLEDLSGNSQADSSAGLAVELLFYDLTKRVVNGYDQCIGRFLFEYKRMFATYYGERAYPEGLDYGNYESYGPRAVYTYEIGPTDRFFWFLQRNMKNPHPNDFKKVMFLYHQECLAEEASRVFRQMLTSNNSGTRKYFLYVDDIYDQQHDPRGACNMCSSLWISACHPRFIDLPSLDDLVGHVECLHRTERLLFTILHPDDVPTEKEMLALQMKSTGY
jgi:hypothetical protein